MYNILNAYDSLMELMNTRLFSFGGDIPVLLIDLLTSLAGLACVFLAGRRSKYNFWVGYLYTMLLFLMFWNKHLYASLMLQPISLGINILGHYRWTHPRVQEQSSTDAHALKVTMLTWRQRIIAVASVFVLAGVWGWLIAQIGGRWFPQLHIDPVPYLDACVTVLILVAQFLSALKKWDCWLAWLLVNITQLILHISVGHIFMPIVCGLYLINGVVSLVGWYKGYQNKE
ncbi:MAG: nicotinamide riboside transporter PnuC [Candidatus Cryptobacteroides sp.]